MKVFKWVICLVLTTLIFIFTCFSTAFADEANPPAAVKKYAYADLGSSTYLCEKPDENTAKFIIPQTYCVEILGEDKNWYRVKYAEDNGLYRAVEGFCLKDDLILCDQPLENLYLHKTIEIKYTTDKPSSLLPGLEDIVITAAFYGSYEIGKTGCSYVYCNDKFGYISGVITDYPLNTLPERPTMAPASKGSTNAALIAAIVVTVAAAAAICVLYFTGKRPPKAPPPVP